MKIRTLSLFVCLFILISIQFISASWTISNFTAKDIYINGTISINELRIDAHSLEIYTLSTSGKFNNNNPTPKNISFYTLTSPYNDIRWDNGSTIVNDTVNYNVTIPAYRFIEVGDYYSVAPPIVDVGGSGGGIVIMLEDFSVDYDTWFKNKTNELKITTFDKDRDKVDVTKISIESNDIFTYESFRKDVGEYLFEIFVNETISKIDFDIEVVDSVKSVKKELTIDLKDQSIIEDMKIKLSDLIESGDEGFKKLAENPIYLLSFIFLMFFFMILILFKKKKKVK